MQIVNVGLIAHPMNWVIIFLMLVIGAIAGHELLSLAGKEPVTD